MLSTLFQKNYGRQELPTDSDDTRLNQMNQDELQVLLNQTLQSI